MQSTPNTDMPLETKPDSKWKNLRVQSKIFATLVIQNNEVEKAYYDCLKQVTL